MSYQEHFSAVLNKYDDLYSRYKEMTQSAEYHNIIATMPFEFLDASQLYTKLELFERLDPKPKMHFHNLEEAIVFYQSLLNCKAKTSKLLEDASFIAQVGALANEINEVVMESPYLGVNYVVIPNDDIISVAEKCLSQLPNYPNVMTKGFRWSFIESTIRCLGMEDLAKLCERGIIKGGDLDHISLTETENNYKEKLAFLCELLNHPHPVMQSYELKLKGVTFPNEDGSSRQENLNILREYVNSHPGEMIPLEATSYTYFPEIGDSEPAIKIAWNGKVIGNVAKDVVIEISERFKTPQFTASLVAVTGGDKVSNGCTITLNILSPELEIEHTER